MKFFVHLQKKLLHYEKCTIIHAERENVLSQLLFSQPYTNAVEKLNDNIYFFDKN